MMVTLTLKEALEDEDILHRLVNHPKGFKFHEAVHLSVGIKNSPPYATVVDDADGGGFTASGPSTEVIKLLSKVMNFTYTLVQSREWGAQTANGSWTGLVGLTLNEDADLVTANICRSEARNQVVDYSRAISVVRGEILVTNGIPTIDPWGFANPLQSKVWAGFFLSLALMWATSVTMDRLTSSAKDANPILTIFLRYLRICFNQYLHIHKEPLWKRFLVGSWLCLVSVLFWSYNCSLISLLATRVIPRDIQSLEDLVRHPEMGLIMEKNNIFAGFVNRAQSGTLLEAKKLGNQGRLLFLPNKDISFGAKTLVGKGSHALFTGSGAVSMILTEDFNEKARCNYYIARDPVLYFNCGMITKKGNPILPAIDYRLSMLASSGLFNYWVKRQIMNVTTCTNAPTKITVQEALALGNIWGMLVVWLSGMVLAMATFLIEVLV